MVREGWREVKIGEVVNLSQGQCINAKSKHLLAETGLPLLRITDLINDNQKQFINPELVNQKVVANPSDLIFTRTGQVGLIFKGKSGVVHNNCFKIIPNEEVLTKEFVYYFFKQPQVYKQINAFAKGAAQADLSHSAFNSLDFFYPKSLQLQQKIAAILSNYDDLIENNEKRIKILENIAKLIYEEWFVRFKFPGHEKVKMVDSGTEFGMVPEGWEVGKVENIAKIQRGISYKSSELAEEGSIPFVNLKCMLPGGNGGFRISGMKRFNGKYKETQKLFTGDIVMGITEMTQKREIIARPARIPEMNEKNITFSMDLVKIIPKEGISKSWLYSFLKYSSFGYEVKEFANGANVLHLNPKHITDYEMILPKKEIREKFSEDILKIFSIVDNLQLKNQNLRKTRDLLLPKLISGEIDVSDLDIELNQEVVNT